MGKYQLTIGFMAILALIVVPYTGQVIADEEEDDKIICGDDITPGTVPPAEVLSGPVPGDVEVPAGTTCVLAGAIIDGDVEADGNLLDVPPIPGGSGTSKIDGELKGEGLGEINLANTEITGDVEIEGKDFVRLGNGLTMSIGGDVELEENVQVDFKNLMVDGDVEIKDNAGVIIFNDKIEGDLKIEGNGVVTISQTEVDGEAECEGDVTNPNGPNTFGENDGCPVTS